MILPGGGILRTRLGVGKFVVLEGRCINLLNPNKGIIIFSPHPFAHSYYCSLINFFSCSSLTYLHALTHCTTTACSTGMKSFSPQPICETSIPSCLTVYPPPFFSPSTQGPTGFIYPFIFPNREKKKPKSIHAKQDRREQSIK